MLMDNHWLIAHSRWLLNSLEVQQYRADLRQFYRLEHDRQESNFEWFVGLSLLIQNFES